MIIILVGKSKRFRHNVMRQALFGREDVRQMGQKLKNLSREKLQKVILKMMDFLTKEQLHKLETIIEECAVEDQPLDKAPVAPRMPWELVEEKMELLKNWMQQIDEEELFLHAEEYEDYSSGYWDGDWTVDYTDDQGIGEKIESVIRFANDCVEDRRYQEANFIYEWLWEMQVSTDDENVEAVDLEQLAENGIIKTDMGQLALLTLYADYQALEPEKRAEDMYLYFSFSTFKSLHVEDIFRAGRENLTGTEQFWEDWIALLKTKSGEVAGRLLQEAILYTEGLEGLINTADENCQMHPSLYLAAMSEYDRVHNYAEMEELGKRAMEKIDCGLMIRSEVALRAAYASSCLRHKEDVMRFCWECFRSHSTERNFLRLFGMKEMAELYGMRGREALRARIKVRPEGYMETLELRQNVVDDYMYYTLSFYTGDFQTAMHASKSFKGSLGWSSHYIRKGIRLLLLYLYEKSLPSKAVDFVANEVGFFDSNESSHALDFENEIAEESRKCRTSIFWNYFQRWKPYFPMSEEEKAAYLAWAEPLVRSRAAAIVGGQHRKQYGEVAALLAVLGEVKESRGEQGAKEKLFAEYKMKFPRHSSFQSEMKNYFK